MQVERVVQKTDSGIDRHQSADSSLRLLQKGDRQWLKTANEQ
jgi:hypothetical protein